MTNRFMGALSTSYKRVCLSLIDVATQTWADAVVGESLLSIEHGPALLIAQPLVVKHEFSDLDGKLFMLPLALQSTSILTLIFRSHGAYGSDRIGSCTQFVCCHMSHCHSLSGGMSRFLCCAAHPSGCGIGCKGSLAGFSHRNLTPHPSMRLLNRPALTIVTGLRLLEEVQYVLRAISHPNCKKAMVCVL
jgi:hypothetical protein